jgi:hypothetical protein
MRLGQTKEQIEQITRDPLGIEAFKKKKRAEALAKMVKLIVVWQLFKGVR